MAAQWTPWHERHENKLHIAALRERLAQEQTNILIFLGAGLSYGVGRPFGRVGLDSFEWRHYDDRRFPSWNGLIHRMHERLKTLPELQTYIHEVDTFFREQGSVDCAELFRRYVGEPNYVAFLREQFQTMTTDKDLLTPSHRELVRLAPRLIFTTNY